MKFRHAQMSTKSFVRKIVFSPPPRKSVKSGNSLLILESYSSFWALFRAGGKPNFVDKNFMDIQIFLRNYCKEKLRIIFKIFEGFCALKISGKEGLFHGVARKPWNSCRNHYFRVVFHESVILCQSLGGQCLLLMTREASKHLFYCALFQSWNQFRQPPIFAKKMPPARKSRK